MDGERPPEKLIRVAPKGVVTRISTDMRAVPDLGVARALRYIHQNYANPGLAVPQIAAAGGVSRRKLEIAFRKTLDHSIHDEIADVRLKQVKKLLRESTMTIATIAEETGFRRPNHLFRTFKMHTGLTPTDYRRSIHS
jgi:LacI family transcriptional regulator